MKYLNKKAKKIMDKLVDGLTEEGGHKKIDNAGPTFMPVVVELLRDCELGKIYSVTHYYEQNGDAMRDPDMEFIKAKDENYYPIYFRQDGVPGLEQEVLIYNDNGQIAQYRPKLMNDLARFGNTWMQNIKEQQGI